jgi:hypothetical protein
MKPMNINDVTQPVSPLQPKAAVAPLVPDARFQAEMPNIPGVTPGTRERSSEKLPDGVRAALFMFALLLVAVGGGWWALHTKPAPAPPAAQDAAPSAVPVDLPPAKPSRPRGNNEIGSVDELAQPWAAKKFSYVRPVTHEEVPAIAIRLPGGSGKTSASYWVILLKAPFGRCGLEYVANTKEIASRYGYNATHPMIADACSGTLYDPLKMGTLPDGNWARGEIVQGAGFRPPLQIEVRIEGDRIVAGRSED